MKTMMIMSQFQEKNFSKHAAAASVFARIPQLETSPAAVAAQLSVVCR